jgi:hypothetical protein
VWPKFAQRVAGRVEGSNKRPTRHRRFPPSKRKRRKRGRTSWTLASPINRTDYDRLAKFTLEEPRMSTSKHLDISRRPSHMRPRAITLTLSLSVTPYRRARGQLQFADERNLVASRRTLSRQGQTEVDASVLGLTNPNRTRYDNLGMGIGYPSDTRSDGYEYGDDFLPVGDTRTRSESRWVWDGYFFSLTGNPTAGYLILYYRYNYRL